MSKLWRYLFLMLVLCGVVLGCSNSGSILRSKIAPDWVSGESTLYPQKLYVTATGSASEPERAKDRAMGNLARIFEARIVATSSTTSDTESRISAGEEKADSKQRLAERINVHTDKLLEGLRIAELWQNTEDLNYHALAILERKHAGNMLRQEINNLDKDSAFELTAIDSQPDDLKRIATYQRVIQLQESRNNIQKTLKVIDLEGKGVTNKWSLVELQALSAKAMAGVKLAADVEPGALKGLVLILQSAISHAGFMAVETKADYTLSAEVDIQNPEHENNWYWQRGLLTIRLTEADSGVIRGSHSWPLKVSSTRQSQLLSRFKHEIDKTLKKELKDIMIRMAGAE